MFLGYYMHVVCVLNVGLLQFPLLLDPCSSSFYTTIALKSYTAPENVFIKLVKIHNEEKLKGR